MKYLDCIELLNLASTILHATDRVQVSVKKMLEFQMVLVRIQTKLGDDLNNVVIGPTLTDLFMSVQEIEKSKGIEYLSAAMKATLVAGILSIKYEVCKLAYNYYSYTDFKPDATTIPLMREVVEYA